MQQISSLICTISRTAQDSRFLEALFLFSQCAPHFVSNSEQETFAVCLIVTETVVSKKLSTRNNFLHNFNSTIIVSTTSKNTKIAGYFLFFKRVDKHLLKLWADHNNVCCATPAALTILSNEVIRQIRKLINTVLVYPS